MASDFEKIAQSDTMLRSAWRIDARFLVACSISFTKDKTLNFIKKFKFPTIKNKAISKLGQEND